MASEYRFAKLETMSREVADLRQTLAMDCSYSIDQWEGMLPQQTRDALAARALIECCGDAFRAAARLGFSGWKKYHSKDFLPLLQRLFSTPGVREILERDLAKPEEHRAALLARQVEIALYGPNKEATSAFIVLAKTCGWQKTPDVLVQHNRQTILNMVTEKNHRGMITETTVEALPGGFLEHEPGSAVRIDSGSEIVDQAIGEDE